MLTYLAILALGIIGIYRLREGLFILQDQMDEKRAAREVIAESMDSNPNVDISIIPNNGAQCKQFKRAG